MHRRGFSSLASRKSVLFPGVKRLTDLVITKGLGNRVWTADGHKYLDFSSGIGVLSVGHCHPTVVKAVQHQATQISHAQQSILLNDTVLGFADRLLKTVPKPLDQVAFANSGAEAVEIALRLARQASGRDHVIAMTGGYHGRTSGTLAITSSAASYRGNRAGPLPGGTVWAPFPYSYAGTSEAEALRALDNVVLQQNPASDTAALIVETVLGEGGYLPPPPGYLQKVRDFCNKHGILLILDEVQAGYGRTGTMWAFEQDGVIPDILVAAKGIASGYPLSAVISRSDLTSKQPKNAVGGTYGGNAVACAAANAVLDVFQQEHVLANVRARGTQLMEGLRAIKSSKSAGGSIGEVRGRGLMIGVEFDPAHKKYNGIVGKVQEECLKRSMIVLATGHRQTIRLIPSLLVTEDEVKEGLDILAAAVGEASK